MARTARSLHACKKRRKILKQAKGYRGTKNSSYKRAKEQVWKSGVYAYVGRKQKKRDFRALWIQRINAAARQSGLSYSQFIHGVKLAGLDLDRKILAELAATEPVLFAAIATQAKNALEGKSVETTIDLDWTPTEPQPRTAAKKGTVSRSKKNKQRRASFVDQDPSTSVGTSVAGGAPTSDDDDVEATEAAEERADDLGIEVESVAEGSGEEGRVLVDDVEEEAAEQGVPNPTDAAGERASELDVDLSSVEGTGSSGAITVEDVEKAAEDQGKVVATDGAEEKATELDVDLSTVEGTGAHGRITVEDVEKAAKASDDE